MTKEKIISYLSYCSVSTSIIEELNELDTEDSFFKFFNNFTKLKVLIDSIKSSSDFSINNFKNKSYDSLNVNLNVDVCIIGGGITGISCGYYLSKNNL